MPVIEADPRKLPDPQSLSGPLADRVYEALRNAILTLDFPPGAVIRKSAVCDQLGVSRTPVSDAILKLEAEGLVEVVPQSATRVSRMSMREIREDAFLREAIEVAAAEYAAEHLSDALLGRLTRSVRLQKLQLEDGDYEEFHKFDQEFHRLILDCCGVSRIHDTVRFVSNHVDRARFLLLPEPGRVSDAVAEHIAILEAIRSGDPAAARRAMKRHLRQLLERLAPLEKERPELFVQAPAAKPKR